MRRTLTSLLCATALLTGAAACSDDDDTGSSSSTEAPPTTADGGDETQDVMELEDFASLEPGTYSIDPDGEPDTPLRVTYDVAEEGWSQWLGAVKFADVGYTAITITTVKNLVEEGCTGHRPADPPVGPGVDDLVEALTALEPFEVSEEPSDVEAFGYEGTKLQLRVPDLEITGSAAEPSFADCTDGNLQGWIAKNSQGAFFGYHAEPGFTEDYWILDVDGTRLVVTLLAGPSSPAADVAEVEAIFDSIEIAT